MQIAWSANFTGRLSRSASEYTATVGIPRSLHAQITRSAISPRFAISSFLNRPDAKEGFSVFHRLAVGHFSGLDHAGYFGRDFVHQFHGLNDAKNLTGFYMVPNLD